VKAKRKQAHRKPQPRPTRAEQVDEAAGTQRWSRTDCKLQFELIFRFVNRVARDRRAIIALDLTNIVEILTTADPNASREKWQRYRRHFHGERNRLVFFRKLRAIARQIAMERLSPIRAEHPGHPETVKWDDSLMPPEAAGHLVRVATLYPGVLEGFLPRFFERISELESDRSTFERAECILRSVQEFGWSAEKHTRRIKANSDESRTLATFRDTLLPKLLSGDRSVKVACTP